MFDVVATDGDPNLGGFDFDFEISKLIVEDLHKQGYNVDEYNDALFSEIREKAEILKRGLSNVEQSTAIFTIEGTTYRVRITRQLFEEATKTLLKRTRERLELLMEAQHCRWSEIDYLLMIGGSTRMPMVKQMLEELSGRSLKYEIDPDIAVALGAGIYAHTLSGAKAAENNGSSEYSSAIVISDVTSQSLGVITVDDRNKDVNSIIIQNNTKIPAKAADVFFTVMDNQTELNVQVTEGNDADVNYIKVIGEQIFKIPPYPKGSPVRVTFAYDIDQTVFVEVEDLTANVSLGTFDIDRVSNLSDTQVKGLANKIDGISVE
jgi:molecular chaperone DnaK